MTRMGLSLLLALVAAVAIEHASMRIGTPVRAQTSDVIGGSPCVVGCSPVQRSNEFRGVPEADTCGIAAADAGGGESATVPVVVPRISPLGARNDLPNPYAPPVHWGRLPNGRKFDDVIGLSLAPDGTIWAHDNCGPGPNPCHESPFDPILQFDTSGRLLRSFGRGLIATAHKITVDHEGFIWVEDIGTAPGKGQQVLKFTPTGQVVMRLGTAGVRGPGLDQFDSPTDVAIARNGDIFVADGQSGNARVVKFDKTGKFLKTWGRKGTGPGEFDVVHAIALDSRGRVFVGDRNNSRVQIFDADGKFIDQWYQFGRPSGIYIDRNDVMYVGDSYSPYVGRVQRPSEKDMLNPGTQRGIRIGSARDGSVHAFIPDPCPYPYYGVQTGADGVVADADGNVYSGEFLGTIRKYVKRK